MTWIRRILIGLLVTVVLLVAGLAGVVALEMAFGQKATDFTNVSYLGDEGVTLHGYLAQPEGAGAFPAVLMVHEWWGLNGEITEMADRLAEEGYVVLAPDTYRGETTTLMPRALYLRVSTPEIQVNDDMWAAYAYLAGLDNVDLERIAVLGFCYGGGVALRHAVDNPAVAATINLYGSRVNDPAALGALLESGAPLLGIFGAEDTQIPLAEVAAFEAALDSAGIPHTVTVYEGVGHAFVNPESIDAGGAAAAAWTEILAFLASALQPA